MKLLYSLLLFILLNIPICSYSQLQDSHQNANIHKDTTLSDNYYVPEYVVVSDSTDSALVSPSTKYYYRYKYIDFNERKSKPEQILANIYNHGIIVIEAWYSPGSDNIDFGHGVLKTVVLPRLVIGIAADTVDKWGDQFEIINNYDPLAASKSKSLHYVFKGMKQAAPNQALKLTE
jgi:hypothetical protein